MPAAPTASRPSAANNQSAAAGTQSSSPATGNPGGGKRAEPKRPPNPDPAAKAPHATTSPTPAAAAAPRPSLLNAFALGCDALLRQLKTAPCRLLFWILGIYGSLWFLASISFPSMPFDSYEMFIFGREMQWGYWKHPPLEPWMTEIAWRLTGGWTGSHFLLAIGSIVVTLYFVWLIGVEMVGASGAVLAVALTILIYYFGPPVTMYSHNVGQLPIWAATIYIYRKAVLGNARLSWILFGLAAAILMYSKYSGALLLGVLALHLLLTQDGRKRIATSGPWIAAATGLVLLLPNLIWLVQNNFSPFTFAFDRPPITGFVARVGAGLKFLIAQFGFHAGPIVIAALAAIPRLPLQGPPVEIDLDRPSPFDRSLVLATAFVPMLLIAIMTAWAGVDQRPEIGGSLVALSGLAMVLLLPSRTVLRAPTLVTSLWLLVLVGLPIGHVAFNYIKAGGSGRLPSQMYPARNFSAAMQSVWFSRTTLPLDSVTGDFLPAGMVAQYATPRPSVFIDADVRKSPWITPQRLKQSGTLVVWSTDDFPRTDELPAPYRQPLDGLTAITGSMVLPLGRGKLQTYGWAVALPPDAARPPVEPQAK
jgi:hypothetical protein